MTSKTTFGATIALLFSLSAAASGCGESTSGPPAEAPVRSKGVQTGATAADFTARDLDGKTVRLGTYLGKQVILLNFWQTWCEPCVAEFPHLRRLYESHRERGFLIVGVAMDGPETAVNIPSFTKRNQITFPVLLDDDSHIASLYNPKKSAPMSVLIDRHGKIANIREGYNPGDEDYLMKDVERALDGKEPAQ